ncbi:MAG: tetratricopeptide repeat protein [Bacteroidetes bacterium]|nr:tetratricopeptide repeat protein [Bacteroidota bacterium]
MINRLHIQRMRETVSAKRCKHFFAAAFPAFMLLVFSFLMTACKTVAEADPTPTVTNSREQFKTLFHEAMSEKMLGHYDRAVVLFEQCLVLEQNNGAVHFALSDLYKIAGDAPKAIQHGNSAFNSDKTNKWYALNLAQLYYAVSDYKNSAVYFDLAIGEEEQNLELKYQYTEVLMISGEYEKAIAMINDIEVETGRLPELTLAKYELYRALGKPDQAEAEIAALLEENPGNIDYRVTLGGYYLGQENYEKAKEMGEAIIRINPENGEGYFLLADAEMRLKNTRRAFDLYKTGFAKESVSMDRKLELIWQLSALPFDGSNPNAAIAEAGLAELFTLIYDPSLKNLTLHTYYGSFLLNQGKTEEALKQFKIVCDLNASDFTSWNQLLFLESGLNAYADLYTDAQKAIELFPSQAVFYLHAGIGAYETGKFSEAEEFLFLGKDLVVNNPELLGNFYLHLGKMECRQKKMTEGYAYFEQSKKANPAGAKVYAVEAQIQFDEGKIQQAEATVQVGLSINPYEPDVLHIQGLIYLHKKEYKAALQALESAAVHDNKNGLVLEHYGDALFLNGQKEKALQMWIEAQNHGNQSELLKRKIADKNYYEN